MVIARSRYVGLCLEGFFYGTTSVLQLSRFSLLKQSNIMAPSLCRLLFILGLYSGILVMYLQYYVKQGANAGAKRDKILFYALCFLYVLSVAGIVLDIANFVISSREVGVSKNGHLQRLFNFALINLVYWQNYVNIVSRVVMGQATVFACGDFIAQLILVCTSGDA